MPDVKHAERPPAKPEHLIVCVNGIWGSWRNWKFIKRAMERRFAAMGVGETTLICPCRVNARFHLQTYEGIDVCGKRLSQEMQETVEKYPSLLRLSILAHSMGGLIARYALGQLFDPATGTVLGLHPCHFVSLATPHLGCAASGPAEIPFWTKLTRCCACNCFLLPWLGICGGVYGLRRSGQQMYCQDGSDDFEPLMMRMTRDVPGEGHFFSALAAFTTRTCYANVGGDQVVAWANASVRSKQELPDIHFDGPHKGVVREDHLLAGLSNGWVAVRRGSAEDVRAAKAACMIPEQAPPVKMVLGGDSTAATAAGHACHGVMQAKGEQQRQHSVIYAPRPASASERREQPHTTPQRGSYGDMKAEQELQRHHSAVRAEAGAAQQVGEQQPTHHNGTINGSSQGGSMNGAHEPAALQQGPAPGTAERQELDSAQAKGSRAAAQSRKTRHHWPTRAVQLSSQWTPPMLERLQLLPWRRIDVSWRDSCLACMGHTHIQRTRPLLDWAGEVFVQHLGDAFAELEAFDYRQLDSET